MTKTNALPAGPYHACFPAALDGNERDFRLFPHVHFGPVGARTQASAERWGGRVGECIRENATTINAGGTMEACDALARAIAKLPEMIALLERAAIANRNLIEFKLLPGEGYDDSARAIADDIDALIGEIRT